MRAGNPFACSKETPMNLSEIDYRRAVPMPFGLVAHFSFVGGNFECAWAPDQPWRIIRKSKAKRRFIAAYTDARNDFIRDLATITGLRMVEQTQDTVGPISTPGTPVTFGSPTRSLWQTNAASLKAVLPVTWANKPTSVAYVDAISW
ncbi:hypothetical protein ACIQUG_03510 [Ensifer sp. NPDC090286]|uniref:hypothetical protein n=1 Tax=Ensifer sp. NPDC090286 TaxID=3363991 RepID=UPI00383B9B89